MMFPAQLSAPEPAKAPDAQTAARAAPGSLMDHIFAARRKRLQETGAIRAQERRRNWAGWAGIPFVAALVVYINQPGTKAADRPTKYGVASVGTYGCPDKADTYKLVEIAKRELARRSGRVGELRWLRFAEEHCAGFEKGERVVIEHEYRWSGVYYARRPGDPYHLGLWFPLGAIHPEAAQ